VVLSNTNDSQLYLWVNAPPLFLRDNHNVQVSKAKAPRLLLCTPQPEHRTRPPPACTPTGPTFAERREGEGDGRTDGRREGEREPEPWPTLHRRG
jgi:hypothetical protein